MKKTNIIIIAVILISFAIALYLYPSMPEQMASHWNSKGEVDGFMSKFWGLFLMPIVTLGMYFLFIFLPKIDPLKKNIEKFRKYYDALILLIILFMFYTYILTLLWNLGYRFGMTQAISPAMAILFFFIGFIMNKLERNWFVGIRTPWTLSSDIVWKKTHELGGKLFMFAGILAFLGAFFPDYAIWLILVPILAVTLFIIVYSYFEYRRVKK